MFVSLSLQGKLDEESVRSIYPELLKRMDDSNNQVRFAILPAFQSLFIAFKAQHDERVGLGHGWDTMAFSMVLKGLLLHMDDQDADLGTAIAETMQQALLVDKQCTLEEIQTGRGKARHMDRYDALLNTAGH